MDATRFDKIDKVTLTLADIMRSAAYFSAYFALAVVVPGLFLVPWLSKARRVSGESSAAAALLAGLIWHLTWLGALRWVGLSYPMTLGIYAGATVALCAGLAKGHRRQTARDAARALISTDLCVAFAFAIAAAIFFSYQPIDKVDVDELLRMSFAASAARSFPAQNPLVFTGLLKYHYLVDFFAGSIWAVTRIPLSIVYFRLLVPFNWLLLLFGMRTILRRHNPKAGGAWLAIAFCLLFVAHENQVDQLTFRDNTFALGFIALGMSALWTGLAEDLPGLAFLGAIAAAPATFAKAPAGSLYTAFVWLIVALYWQAGRLRPRRALGLCALSAGAWLGITKVFLIEAGGAKIFRPGLSLASLQGLAPYVICSPRLISWLQGHRLGAASGILFLTENILTVARLCALPILAVLIWFYRRPQPRPWSDRSDSALLLKSTAGAFLVGSFLYCFVRYTISPSSDVYWMWFAAFILSVAAFPALSMVAQATAIPSPLKAVTVAMTALMLVFLPKYWLDVHRVVDNHPEPWSPGRSLACSYVAEHTAPGELFLHNVLDRPHKMIMGFCAQRMYTSYSTHNGVWENFAVYDQSLAAARKFFNGQMENPSQWLATNHIQYVLWDTNGSKFEFPEFADTAGYLHRVYRDPTVALYSVEASTP